MSTLKIATTADKYMVVVDQNAVNPYLNAQALIQAQTALYNQCVNGQKCLNLGKAEPITQMIKQMFDVSPAWHKNFDVVFTAKDITLGVPRRHVYAKSGENEPFDVQIHCFLDDNKKPGCDAWAVRPSGQEFLLDKLYEIQQNQDKCWEETTVVGKIETRSVQANDPLFGIELIKAIAPKQGTLISLVFWNTIEEGMAAGTSALKLCADKLHSLFARHVHPT